VYNRVLSTATEGLRTTKPVKLISTGGRTFTDLVWPTAAETNRYLDWYRMKLADPEASRVLNQNELDSLYFNDASWQNWKTFRLCIKTIPSFAMAKTIFDYCAAQGCYLGTAQVQPCIPFEYVPDGCFVRAHKMKEIIEKKFSYCCEKVFSYGELNIRADKWGGCCISWWYHVAPMIRVKEGGRTVCYVIDPSMFNEPVLLSTWLDAQQNTSCNPNARVNRYSIQPSSAYTPEYTTDPNYADTNFNLPYFDFLGNSCPN
jgi:Glutaminase